MSGAGYGNHDDDSGPNVPVERPDPAAAAQDPKGGQDRPGFDLGGVGEGTGPGGGGLQPAGPHADPALTNNDATPGAGTLPGRNKSDGDVDTGSA